MKLRKLGIMQGRLSPTIKNKIQFFPTNHWAKEFKKAKSLGISYIEWTLDQKKLYSNPIFTKSGIKQIKNLKKKNKIEIISLTGDCFMQKPFWKIKKNNHLKNDLFNIISACSKLKIKYVIVPLVDQSSLKNKKEEKRLIAQFKKITPFIKKCKVEILFESDYEPYKLKKFIENFDKRLFGINYDTGNSASLGYNIDNEFKIYGKYIKNIHIKDRLYKGKTIRLGEGNVNFKKLFKNINKINYKSLLVLQTARSTNAKHIEEIKINKRFLINLLN